MASELVFSDCAEPKMPETPVHDLNHQWYLDYYFMSPGRELSTHGLRLAFRRRLAPIVRLAWFCLFLVFLTIFCTMSGIHIKRYLQVPKMVKRSFGIAAIEFPSVSVCNLNPYKSDAMQEVDELVALESYFTELRNSLLEPVVPQVLDAHKHANKTQCPPVRIKNGYPVYSDTMRIVDSNMSILCDAKFNRPQAEDGKQYLCQENGKWEAFTGCIYTRCDEMKGSTEWRLSVTKENQNLRHNTMVQVKCLKGYEWREAEERGGETLDTVRNSTCNNGTWVPELDCKRTNVFNVN